jgi:3-oxoacyl-[acyl-carrier-protein] synthase III
MSVLPDLHVIGMGAVSPAGPGTLPLLNQPGPELFQEPMLRHPEKSVGVRKVDLQNEALLRWQKEPRLRRASPLALFLMEAASQTLEQHPGLDRSRLGLICALGTGSICYSRRFFVDTLKRGRRFASPALFPETVYNSPVSHVASILGIQDACYSLMGDESAWPEALRVAQVWLARGKVEAVLVLAGEELDAITVEAFYRAGWLKRGVILSEGAAAVLVQSTGTGSWIRPDLQTLPFRSASSQEKAWRSRLSLPSGSPSLFLPGNVVPPSFSKNVSNDHPRSGPDWGAAFTASSAWATLQMLQSLHSGTLLVPGCTSGVTRLQIGV